MQTTKQTVITLDEGDEIIVRRKTGLSDIQCRIVATSVVKGDDSADNPRLEIHTSEVVWTQGADWEAVRNCTLVQDNSLLGEYRDITITPV